MNQKEAAFVLDVLKSFERSVSSGVYYQRLLQAEDIVAKVAQPFRIAVSLSLASLGSGDSLVSGAKDLREARTIAKRYVNDGSGEVWISKKVKIVEIWRRGADGKPERSL